MKLCIKIYACEKSGGYCAICPSLPGCKTHGETKEEAKKKLQEAMCGYMAAVNDFVPEHFEREMIEV